MNDKSGKSKLKSILIDGMITNNPVFVQLIGMCPTMAVTTSLENGIGMGISVLFILTFSNLFISLVRNLIPSKIRIAAYIIIIAGFVTSIDLLMQAYLPALSESLGIYIPLIVVNCIILARAEAFAAKNKPLPSVADGIGCGIGFTIALCAMSAIREILGSGTLLGFKILGNGFQPALIMIMPAGGFLTLGFTIAFVQWLRAKRKENSK